MFYCTLLQLKPNTGSKRINILMLVAFGMNNIDLVQLLLFSLQQRFTPYDPLTDAPQLSLKVCSNMINFNCLFINKVRIYINAENNLW